MTTQPNDVRPLRSPGGVPLLDHEPQIPDTNPVEYFGELAKQFPEGIYGMDIDREPEVTREHLGPVQVRLLELQPRKVSDLDHGVAGAPWVLAPKSAQFAVKVLVGRMEVGPVDGWVGHGLLQETMPQ